MTSLVVWVAADSHGPSSLNIASDSRISWSPQGGRAYSWDHGKKVYASSTEPLLIGYTGDVLFPSLVIPSLIDSIDRGVFPADGKLLDYVYSVLRHGWRHYPTQERRSLSLFVCYRAGQGMEAKFQVEKMFTNSRGDWSREEIAVPAQSMGLAFDGSGRTEVQRAVDLWQDGPTANTSRAIFSGFVDAVTSDVDTRSGGSPQLGSIYRIGPGRLLGIVHGNEKYFAGARLLGAEQVGNVEWRNALFERADGTSKSRLAGAQVHERPDSLS